MCILNKSPRNSFGLAVLKCAQKFIYKNSLKFAEYFADVAVIKGVSDIMVCKLYPNWKHVGKLTEMSVLFI